jgi:hypothetical protein
VDRVLVGLVESEDTHEALGLRLEFEVLAAPGATQASAVNRLLITAADAVVFLPHRGNPSGRESRRALRAVVRELDRLPRRPVDVPLLVQDYSDGEPRLSQVALEGSVLRYGARFVSVEGDTAPVARRLFGEAQASVLSRVRELEGRVGAPDARAILTSTHERALPGETRRQTGSGGIWLLLVFVLWACLGAALYFVGLVP